MNLLKAVKAVPVLVFYCYDDVIFSKYRYILANFAQELNKIYTKTFLENHRAVALS